MDKEIAKKTLIDPLSAKYTVPIHTYVKEETTYLCKDGSEDGSRRRFTVTVRSGPHWSLTEKDYTYDTCDAELRKHPERLRKFLEPFLSKQREYNEWWAAYLREALRRGVYLLNDESVKPWVEDYRKTIEGQLCHGYKTVQ